MIREFFTILFSLFAPPEIPPPPQPPPLKEILWEAMKLDPYAGTDSYANYDEWLAAARKQLKDIRSKSYLKAP